MKPTPKVVVLGDSWSGPLFAKALLDRGHIAELFVGETSVLDGPEAIIVGNGETRRKAGLVFGDTLAEKVWSISERNFQSAKELFSSLGLDFCENGLLRFSNEGTPVSEPGISFSPVELAKALGAKLERPRSFSRLLSIQPTGSLEFQAILQTEQGVDSIQAPLFVVVTESFERDAIRILTDKRIPVSLSQFLFPASDRFTGSVALLNSGADFGVSDGRHLLLGSYRNLYEDRGVGLHDSVDPVTQKNILSFFSKQGWIDPTAAYEATVKFESVTCDGLPLVGTLPGLSGVVFVTGFAAHGGGFLFEVAQRVANGLLGLDSEALEVFSPSRLL